VCTVAIVVIVVAAAVVLVAVYCVVVDLGSSCRGSKIILIAVEEAVVY
jgi:hypothetical protein